MVNSNLFIIRSNTVGESESHLNSSCTEWIHFESYQNVPALCFVNFYQCREKKCTEIENNESSAIFLSRYAYFRFRYRHRKCVLYDENSFEYLCSIIANQAE